MYSINDLNSINQALVPLKILADRELESIYGLTGKVYTPHIDNYSEVCIKKAQILLALKTDRLIPFTDVELISKSLMVLHPKAKNRQVIEYQKERYECRYSPLTLSKSGKSVRKWAKYWLKTMPDGTPDAQWHNQVREIWPEYFIIRSVEI